LSLSLRTSEDGRLDKKDRVSSRCSSPSSPGKRSRAAPFTSVKDLITAMHAYIDAWNERCEPFTLDQGADSILTEVRS
jgi:hypothetical protein